MARLVLSNLKISTSTLARPRRYFGSLLTSGLRISCVLIRETAIRAIVDRLVFLRSCPMPAPKFRLKTDALLGAFAEAAHSCIEPVIRAQRSTDIHRPIIAVETVARACG